MFALKQLFRINSAIALKKYNFCGKTVLYYHICIGLSVLVSHIILLFITIIMIIDLFKK